MLHELTFYQLFVL